MKVRVLGAHHLEIQPAKHTCFLLDGSIAIDAGSLMTATSSKEQKNIQAILLTHRHLDHVRDLPTLGLANLHYPGTIDLYSLPETLDTVFSRIMDGTLYPDFSTDLTGNGPKYLRHSITPGESFSVLDYSVRAISVPHTAPTIGYVIQQNQGRSFAYCGDTGGGLLTFFQDPLKPDPLFVEVTFGSGAEELAKVTGHLTPKLLRSEIIDAMEHGLPIPRLLVVHRNPDHESEISQELERVSSELEVEIVLAQEDMIVEV